MEGIPARLAIGLTALLALVCSAAIAGAAGPTDLLPDLVADPPANPQVVDYDYGNGSRDLLLRFDGYVHNAGAGALDVRGARATNTDPMTPLQRVYRSDASYHDVAMPGAELTYTTADGHNHFHLQRLARYSLWASDKSAEIAPAMKVGFCLEDSEHVDGFGPGSIVYTGNAWCEHNNPNALSTHEGVSSGWRDTYPAYLEFQYVVVSDVQPGAYRLREDIDTDGGPDGIVHESNESNVPAWSAPGVTVPGYAAKAVTAPATPYGQAQDVTLAASTFGSPGARRFRVVEAPGHGTLDVATGTDVAGSKVTYTPTAGYSGPDNFVYEAVDSTSDYPRHPSTATVSLSVGPAPAPSVVIDSAPSAVEVGHGVQLHATVANDVPAVTWSVDGLDGGSAASGTISADGFYTAPPSVPPSGDVTIAARSASGAHDERVVAITDPLPPPPAPGVADGRRTRGALLSDIGEAIDGRLIVATVRPARAGLVSINAHADGRLLGTCRA
ncbi:MAG: hypothetical protein QOJ14_2261, partial [Thermoleophilaceae bacterium]|nr:hypothetical protein [Thermoleophilaceae bacterium]